MDTVSDVGSGRQTIPVWTLHLDPGVPHRLKENGRLAPFGSRGHEVTITSIDVGTDVLELQLAWTARKTRALTSGIEAMPSDPAWVGHEVAFVVSDAADLTRLRSSRVWSAKDGPGAWLTHGKAPAPVEISADDGTDLLVDDIRQIEDGAPA